MSLSLVALAPIEESGGPATPVPLLATVPAPLGTKRLHFSWGLGNRISLCPLVDDESFSTGSTVDGDEFEAEPQLQRRPVPCANNAEPPSASVVQWGSFSASERALAFNSLPLFEALQGELLRSGTRSPTWGRAVRSYAGDISALMMMKGVSEENEESEGDASAASASSLAVERCAWDWTALLFLPSGREDGCLGPALRRWASLHAAALLPSPATKHVETLRSAVARLLCSPAPEREPGYWQTATRAAALGSYGAAVALLGAHSAWNEALTSTAAGGGGGGGGEAAFGGDGGDGGRDLDPDRRRAVASLAALEPVGLLLRRAPRLALGEGEGGARVFEDEEEVEFDDDDASGNGTEATAFTSLPAFLEARRSWLAAVRAVAHDDGLWSRAGGDGEGDNTDDASSSKATATGARRLLAVVAGDRTALDEAVVIGSSSSSSSSSSCSWAELLVARALHAGSGAGPRGAAELAHAAQRAFDDSEKMTSSSSSPPEMSTRDALLLSLADSAARGEPASAAAVLSSACGSWLLAHVAPLLASSSSSSSSSSSMNEDETSSTSTRGTYLPHAGIGSVEWAASDYAAALAGGGGGETASSAAAVATRAAAARVFALCPCSGRSSCAALFHHSAAGVVASSSAAGDDAPAERAAAEAEGLGIRGAGYGVARAAGVAAAASGRVGAALRWFARARDGDRARAAAGPVAEACAEALLVARRAAGNGSAAGMEVDSTAPPPLFASPAAAAAALEDLALPLSEALSAPTRAPVPRRGGLRALRALLELERAEAALVLSPSNKAAAAVVAAAAAAARAAPSAAFAAGALLRAVPALESGVPGIPAAVVDDALAAMAEAEAEARRGERVKATKAKEETTGPTSALAADAVRLALARALARAYLTADSVVAH